MYVLTQITMTMTLTLMTLVTLGCAVSLPNDESQPSDVKRSLSSNQRAPQLSRDTGVRHLIPDREHFQVPTREIFHTVARTSFHNGTALYQSVRDVRTR